MLSNMNPYINDMNTWFTDFYTADKYTYLWLANKVVDGTDLENKSDEEYKDYGHQYQNFIHYLLKCIFIFTPFIVFFFLIWIVMFIIRLIFCLDILKKISSYLFHCLFF